MAWFALIGVALSALAQKKEGEQANQEKNFEADQATALASSAKATAQRAAIEERRRGDYLESRGQAVAAASGGGATDPTVLKEIADVHGEAEYRALTRMYEGDDKAAGLQTQADLLRYQGGQAEKAGTLNAATTIFSAYGSGKFGGGGGTAPSAAPGGDSGGSLFANYGNGGVQTTGYWDDQTLHDNGSFY